MSLELKAVQVRLPEDAYEALAMVAAASRQRPRRSGARDSDAGAVGRGTCDQGSRRSPCARDRIRESAVGVAKMTAGAIA